MLIFYIFAFFTQALAETFSLEKLYALKRDPQIQGRRYHERKYPGKF